MGYTIGQVVSSSERGELEALWNVNFGVATEARFRSYDLNPCGRGRLWSLKTDAGQLAGAVGWMQRRYMIDGETVEAAQSLSLAIDSQHRSAGPALMLVRTLVSSLAASNSLFVIGASRAAQPVMKRAGFRMLCDAERWTKPLHSEYKLRPLLKNPLITRVVASGVDLGLRLISPESWRIRPAGSSIDVNDGFDVRIDELGKRASDQIPILAERTAAILDWRFRVASNQECSLFSLMNEAGSLAGYIVFHIERGVAEVDDFLFADLPAFETLFCEFLRHLRHHPARPHAVSVTYGGAAAISQRLRSFGFSRREEPKQCLICPHPGLDAETQKRLLDPEQWFLTNFELDL